MAQWSVELVQPLGGTITTLPEAADRQFTLSVTEDATLSFTLDGRNPKARYVQPMFTDVVLYRDAVKVFRGRIVQANQSGDAANCKIQVSAVSYKALLKRRFFQNNGHYTGDIEACAWLAINATQLTRPNSDLGITRGVNQSTGITVTKYQYENGLSMKDFIDGVMQTNSAINDANAFEWDIDPDLVFKVYKPTRGKRTPTFLADFGGSVLSYDTQFDPNGYANIFTVQGNGSYNATLITDEGRRPPAAGVFEEFINDGQLTTPALVDSRAFWLGTYNGQLELCKTYNLELSNSRWAGPESCWIGDFIRLSIVDGALNVSTDQMRVMDMHISIDAGGYEGVAISVGYSVPALYRDFGRMTAWVRNTRMDVLRNRANWYGLTNRSLYQEYLRAVKKNGAKSYEANAAKKRWTDFYKQAKSWQKSNGF